MPAPTRHARIPTLRVGALHAARSAMSAAMEKMDAKPTVPVLEGWFTLDEGAPHLIGSCCMKCGTYYFPKQFTFCRNPDCDGNVFQEVKLSRFGKLWSFTDASY